MPQAAAPDSLAYFYNADNGLVAQVTYSNGMACSNSFDVRDRLTALTWMGPSGQVLASRGLAYNVTGTISEETKETGEQAQYFYDSLDRLTTETRLDPAGETISRVVYSYDLAGNRTNKAVYGGSALLATVNYRLGVGNRLTSWSVAQTNYLGQIDVAGYANEPIGTNDQYGYLQVSSGGMSLKPEISGAYFSAYGVSVGLGTQKVVAAIRDRSGNMGFATNTIFMTVVTNGNYFYNTAGCLTNIQYSGKQYLRKIGLIWNSQYQLTATTTNDVAAERCGYDALGNRVWIWSGSATNYLVYDGPHVIAEVDTTGGLRRSYTYGPGIDQVISMAYYSGGATGAPTVYYYLRDQIGSILALTDTNGNIVESYRYDAWGRTTAYDANDNRLSQSAVGNRIAFQGREYSWATGLYFFRARWYDPVTGRWLSPDPIGINGGLNQYVFCSNNPVNFTDAFGLAVGAPGTGESFIPVWGSGRKAMNDFQTGHYVWGSINTVVAVSDVFLVKAAATGIAKGAWKLGSNSWRATRAWMGKTGQAEAKQQVHHWAVPQGRWGAEVPDFFKNQPWNLMPMENNLLHQSIHGVGREPFGPLGQFMYGTPDWFKAFLISESGRIGNELRDQGQDDCK